MPGRRIVIVGAGPAGSATAMGLRRRGVDGVLLLERARFPRPKACGGGLSPVAISLLRKIGLGERVVDRAHPVRSLRFVGPDRDETIMQGTPAAVMNRAALDAALLDEARRLGAEVREAFAVRELIREPAGQGRPGRVVGVAGAGERIAADVVVLADGAHSRFSSDPRPRDIVTTIMGWYEGFDAPPDRMEMIYDRRLLPYYAWVFPESDRLVNIGLCHPGRSGSLNLRGLFADILDDQLGARIRNARQVGALRGHPVSVASWIDRVAEPGALWVGEAARLVNPATCEGIYHAVASGLAASEAIARAASTRADVGLVGDHYLRTLRRRLGFGLAAGGAFRRIAAGPVFPVVCRMGGNPLVRAVMTRVIEKL